MRTILIATSNPGKFHEIVSEYKDLPFKFVSLIDLKLNRLDLDEPYATTWENALHKAKFFAKKTKLLTIAEDTGFYVKALKGMPGIRSKRWATTAAGKLNGNTKILSALKGVPERRRNAYFETGACVYDPKMEQFSIFKGRCDGVIAQTIRRQARQGMDYDAIFYYPPLKKTFSELTPLEKNLVSHRGQVIHQIKFYLTKQYPIEHKMYSTSR